MKNISLIIGMILIYIPTFTQINYINSFIDINLEYEQEPFGTQNLFVPKNNKFVYAFSDSLIYCYHRDIATGKIDSLSFYNDRIAPEGNRGCGRHIATTNDEKFLLISAYCTNSLSVFKIDQNTGACLFIQKIVDGQNGITGFNSPEEIVISDDNLFAYVLTAGGKSISYFSIDTITGIINHKGFNEYTELKEVNSLYATPDNQFIYSTSNIDSSLHIFSRNIIDGSLTYFSNISYNGSDSVLLSNISDITFDKENFVYILSETDCALTIFKSNDNDYSNLSRIYTFKEAESEIMGLDNPRSIELDPNKNLIFILSEKQFVSSAISVFKRMNNDEIRFINANIYTSSSQQGMPRFTNDIEVSADSKFVFVSLMSNSICNCYNIEAYDTVKFDTTDTGMKFYENNDMIIKIFPNPANAFVRVCADEIIDEIKIIGMDGKILRYEAINSQFTSIELDGLSPGNYILSTIVKNKIINNSLILKE